MYSVKFINPRKPERASDWKIQEGADGYNRVPPVQSPSQKVDDWSFIYLRLTAAPPERKRFALAQTNSILGLNCKINKEDADWLHNVKQHNVNVT